MVQSQEQLAKAAKNEAAQLRRKLKSLRAEIDKRNAALELLPGGSLLGADQLLRGFRQVSLRSFWELVQEGNAEALRQDDGFVQCVGKTCQGSDAHVMPAVDITACKQLCRAGGGSGPFGAFVIQGGYAFFRQQPVGQCRRVLKDDPNATTYLNSSPEAAALCADIRKAVARLHELKKQDRRGEAAPATGMTAPMAETWRSLEVELRRKSTQSLELHRRVHELEEELQNQLQATDSRMEQVLSSVRAAVMHSRTEAARGS